MAGNDKIKKILEAMMETMESRKGEDFMKPCIVLAMPNGEMRSIRTVDDIPADAPKQVVDTLKASLDARFYF